MYEIYSKLIIKTLKRNWCRSGVFIVNFEHVSHSDVSIVDFEQLIAGWELKLVLPLLVGLRVYTGKLTYGTRSNSCVSVKGAHETN